MLEELKEDQIVNKVGGRFKLSTLIQKRMIALNQGARPLVEFRGDRMEVVIREIMEDKIFLDLSGNIQTYAEEAEVLPANYDGSATIDLTQNGVGAPSPTEPPQPVG